MVIKKKRKSNKDKEGYEVQKYMRRQKIIFFIIIIIIRIDDGVSKQSIYLLLLRER